MAGSLPMLLPARSSPSLAIATVSRSPRAASASAAPLSRRTSLSSSGMGTFLLRRQDSHIDEPVLTEDEALARRVLSRRARQEARMAALLAASARRVHREEAVEATAAHRRCRPRSAPGRDRLSAKQEVADRAQQRAHDARVAQERAKCLRAMVRLAHPLNRPVVKELLQLSDDEFERACDGWDFDWEAWQGGGAEGAGDFCCVCTAPGLDCALGPSGSCVCLCEGEDLGSEERDSDEGGPSRLDVEPSETLPAPPVPDLRYGSGYEVPRPHKYARLRRRAGELRQPLDDRLLELCTELVDRLRDLSMTGDTTLEPRRLVQLLTVERDEASAPAVVVQEMCTVPHETALRAFALHRSQREAVLRALRADERAADRQGRLTGSLGRNVAFGRAVPIGDPAYRRVPEVLRLAVKCPPELVSFDKVWCSHLLPLRITKRFCKFLETKHPLVPRPRSLVQGGLLRPLDNTMMPAPPPGRSATPVLRALL